ncbi:hypothetical protein VKT23_002601 [Stygiomarasmius scandens]|uniref:Nephrocystin 3-like N-terminal domain-containing protein n=1 Tax=Marasmiellus scandens TaxID=2682957 RepID=A0ABR1K2H6_9AGAR
MSFFSKAHDLVVNNSTFNAVTGNQTNVHYNENEKGTTIFTHQMEHTSYFPSGLALLWQTLAPVGAFHDSEARFPPPKCHPETRKAVLKDLSAWIRQEMPVPDINQRFISPAPLDPPFSRFSRTAAELQTPIHWLYGPAGAGKSAIAQTLSERFDISSGGQRLAASFFFSRLSPTRNNPRFLFTTIAYCLAVWGGDPDLRNAIDKAVQMPHSVLAASIEVQFRKLLVEPLQKLSQESWEKLPKAVVIDGLDESQGSASQKRVLKMILDQVWQPLGDGIPRFLRFLIASRPEPAIRDIFNQSQYRNLTTRTELSDNYSTSADIAKYLRDRFAHIAEEYGEIPADVPLPWPSEGVIQELVQRASGQFIYATTVLKYVEDEYSLPWERLKCVLGLPVGDPEAFSDLDILYRQIMSSNPNKALLLRVLGTRLALITAPFETIRLIEYLLYLPAGTVSVTLRGMHSVLQITTNDFGFLHKSSQDFLNDSRRSKEYFIDIPATHEHLSRRCLEIVSMADFDCSQSE